MPQEELASYLEEILDFCGQQSDIPDVAVYAHASAGCLHVRPLVNVKTQLGLDILETISTHAAGLAVKYGGIMSGEHGDGYARSVHNPIIFGETLYGALQDVKRIFDPAQPDESGQGGRRAAADRESALRPPLFNY